MLARVPAGDLIDRMRHEPKLRSAEVLHSDTTWRPCTVLAWARHRGSWAVLIRWPGGHEDWREYDPRNIRPGRGPTLGTAGPASGIGQIATARVGPGLLRMGLTRSRAEASDQSRSRCARLRISLGETSSVLAVTTAPAGLPAASSAAPEQAG
jgi:hypothetical protein